MPASVNLRTEWIKYAFTATAMGVRPFGWKVRLHTADPGGTGANEVSGSGYVAGGAATSFTQSVGSVSNTADLTFPVVVTSQYIVTHVSIWDTAATPLCLYHGPLAASKTIVVGDRLSFAPGQLVCNVT